MPGHFLARFSCLVASITIGADAALVPVKLRTEWLANPSAVADEKPRLSWRVESDVRADRQTAYRVIVASSEEILGRHEGDLWDSGKVATGATLNVPYAGRALASGQRALWKVEVWDNDDQKSEWSSPGSWSAALKPEAWKAQWISFKDTTPLHTDRERLFLPAARHYRKTFSVQKPVARAVVHASSLGIHALQLNSQRVGDAYFEPGWSDYRTRTYYRTHDVTALVHEGQNALGAIVADGWYAGYVGYGLLVGYGPEKSGRYFYGKTPALFVQLEIEYLDGARETIVTDSSWQVSGDGPFREADLIMGESFDATRDRADWCEPDGAKDWQWERAIAAEENGSVKAAFYDTRGTREVELGFQKPARLQAYPAPPIRVTDEMNAHSLIETKPGVFLFDMGRNFAGNIRLHIKGPAGTKLQIRYGEMLHPDGRLMTENLRRARATDFYTMRGDADGETWTPQFTYHGFEFVEITGLPERPALDAVTGLVIHSDTPLVSRFECSDEVINRLFRNIVWTQRSNFIEVPTDCPQRDERLGWMGDAQIYARAATFNADVAAFFTKWLDDVEEAQRDFGAYPDYAPYPMAHGEPGKTFGAGWTDAGIICPWTMWRVYGDERLLERHWASMRRFMDWRSKSAPDLRGTTLGNSWGDWLNVGETTPIEYIDLCYHALDAQLMAEMAGALGKQNEAEHYRKLFRELRAIFQTEYFTPAGTLSIDTQTAHVLALAFGLAPRLLAPKLAAHLAEKIETNGGHMATGFLGTKPLLPVLSATGYQDLAVRLLQSREFPSWGYEVVNGATTIWERWDSFTKEEGFGRHNAAMNSFSHYAFGAVCEWMFRFLAGIDQEGSAYQKIIIHPRPPTAGSNPHVEPIHWVKAEYDSVRGRIATEWRRTSDAFELDVTIPANTTATVYLPIGDVDDVTENGKPLTQIEGVRFIGAEGDRNVFAIDSGSYSLRTPLR